VAFSCLSALGAASQNVTDLAREAVSCNAVLGHPALERWRFATSGRGIRLIWNDAPTPILLGAPKSQPVVASKTSGYEIAE